MAVDPSTARKAVKREAAGKAANSFEAVASEWYGKREHTWVPRHASGVLHRLEFDLFETLGTKPIAAITAPELLTTLRKIEERGAHDLAHRCVALAMCAT